MKILKFGGSSVGTPESILRVKEIVSARPESAIVVVSALSGVTDQLIRVSRLSAAGDTAFRDEIALIRARHRNVCESVVPDEERRSALEAGLDALLDQLERICEGIYLLQVLPPKTANEVMGFGEQLSSRIVEAVLDGAVRYDATDFI